MTREMLDQVLRQTLPHGRVKASRPAGCHDVALYLFDPAVLQGPLSHEEAQAVVDEPAYWSFCWASGLVLANYLLTNPELVAGRRVLDFGCGSGIVAIAAAMAGASQVIACDSDHAALQATRANAALNGVSVGFCDSWEHRPSRLDLILAADVLYDAENLPLLDAFCDAAKGVLLADSRVRNLGDARYCLQSTVEGRTWPDLNEFEEFNQVRIYKA